MAKRILVVSQHYWPENFRITDMCKGFIEEGCVVDVLCGLPNYPDGEWFEGYRYTGPRREEQGGVQIFRAGEVRRRGNTGVRIFLNYISFPLCALVNLPRLHGRRYDVVFCYETSPVLMMLPAVVYAKMHRIPLVTYVLDLWPENMYSVLPVKNTALRAVASGVSHWFYRRSERLIAMSDALGKKLEDIAPNAKVAVIPQYCEDFYLQDVQNSELQSRFAHKFAIVFAGNISPAQDLSLLVTCAEKLRAAAQTAIHFVIVGDGMSRAALEEEIAQKQVGDYFTFEGQKPVSEIPAYHTMAGALFAALAKSDDLGLTVPAKITSYLAAGRPCLVAMDGEGARVVTQAGAGYACAAHDADALVQNMLRLAHMPAEARASMGTRGREYFTVHFKRDKLLRQILTFMDE